jgi:hypothetical protein
MTTVSLLTDIEHGVPSGNYDGSSEFFVSNNAAAPGFYQGQGSVQTVTINVDNFSGTVTTQATLNVDLASAAWFDIDFYAPEAGITEIYSTSVVGNFVWIRVKIENFDSGTINFVNLSY